MMIHEEDMRNLNCIYGVLTHMNRSIPSKGTYGETKANRWHEYFHRRGINHAILKIIRFNLHKYHLVKNIKS